MAEQTRTERPDSITLIAIYHFIVGALALIGALAILVFAIFPVVVTVPDPMPMIIAVAAIGLGLVLTTAFGVAAVVVGWGLLAMRNWARWAAIVLAILSLPAFPIGTVVGILIIWYLLREDVRPLFERR